MSDGIDKHTLYQKMGRLNICLISLRKYEMNTEMDRFLPVLCRLVLSVISWFYNFFVKFLSLASPTVTTVAGAGTIAGDGGFVAK